ncbi:hypothetical protein H0B56_06930 [Haloechinothrix sp. YIM 98757]|uniref:Uncharacterized protein n=1 Tax=Haloechinothrix aidingensis TaxID=2752311 RepID=A0A838A9F7_9PSEU|nr:hypothetical protein [Haloechinothrix aidingensis]MBA0125272.1 hypothetical protein [Haloechinothrix aidingensis]
MSGWSQVRRRYQLVYAVAEDITRHGAQALDGWLADIDAEFGDLGAFLKDVQRRWHTAVDAHLDGVLERQPQEMATAVAAAFAAADRANASLVRLLDAADGHPALEAGRQRHRSEVLTATGVDPAALPGAAEEPAGRGDDRCPIRRTRRVLRGAWRAGDSWGSGGRSRQMSGRSA